MATFYYNRFSNENYLSQWRSYLQNQYYVNDITKSTSQQTKDISGIVSRQTSDYSGIISRQTKEISESIQSATSEQVFAIQESTNAISGTLNSGFDLLSDNLKDISYGIEAVRSELNHIASVLDWNLSLLIEQQRITNLLLGNIAVLLRIPEIQKERQYYIEQGIKFLKNAFYDNDFYDDALENLLKAENIEPTDFFALHRIGLIYLYSPNHLDLSKAENFFRKAAKYAIAETNAGSGITTNYLIGDVNKNLLTQIPTVDSIKLQAAESYMFAGRCCYIQGKFSEASELAGKSFNIAPFMVEAGFTQAKALSANNNVSQAAIVLKSVIERDRFYALKVASDLDLSPKNEIKILLEKFRFKAFTNASKLLTECKENMIPDSIAIEDVNEIECLVKKKSFLHCKRAIDLSNKQVERTFSDIFESNKSTYKANRNFNELQIKLTKISQEVKYPESYVPKIKCLFNFLSQNTQWNFPHVAAMPDVINYSRGYEPKKLTSTLTNFIKTEKEYFNKLSFSKSKFNKLIYEIYNDDVARRKTDAQLLADKQRIAQKAKNRASINYAISNAFTFGIIGLILGAMIGYGKGCQSYGDYVGIAPLSEPFRYIPENAFYVCIVGAIIGILFGLVKGQE